MKKKRRKILRMVFLFFDQLQLLFSSRVKVDNNNPHLWSVKVFTLALFCSSSHLPSTKAQRWNRTPVSQVEDYSKKYINCNREKSEFRWIYQRCESKFCSLFISIYGLPMDSRHPWTNPWHAGISSSSSWDSYKNSMCKNEWKYITIIRTYFKGIKV